MIFNVCNFVEIRLTFLEGGGGLEHLKNRCSNLNPKSKMATNIKNNWLNLTGCFDYYE